MEMKDIYFDMFSQYCDFELIGKCREWVKIAMDNDEDNIQILELIYYAMQYLEEYVY